MHDREQNPDEVEEPGETASIKELTDDELSHVAGGSSNSMMSYHPGSGSGT